MVEFIMLDAGCWYGIVTNVESSRWEGRFRPIDKTREKEIVIEIIEKDPDE